MLKQGERLVLKCLVRGVPKPSLQWFVNDQPINPDLVRDVETASNEFRESHVIIDAVQENDEGVYQCVAENTYGSGVAKFAKVLVIEPTSVSISKDKSGILTAQAGEKIKIPCLFFNDALNVVTNITWTKNSEAIKVRKTVGKAFQSLIVTT